MAGRYLLIEFDDATQADALRAQINAATKKGKRFRVVGLYARPGKTCTCANTLKEARELRSKTAKAIIGKAFGWWICPQCRRPRSGSQNPKNLLKPHEIIDRRVWREFTWMSLVPGERDWYFDAQTIHLGLFPANPGEEYGNNTKGD